MKQLKRLLESSEADHLLTKVRLLWAAKFRLPPNDERLLRLTVREALEQVNGLTAAEALMAEAAMRRARMPEMPDDYDGGDTAEPPAGFHAGRFRVVEGDAGAAIADKPLLTGDPEWDRMELEETDPSREPLQIAR